MIMILFYKNDKNFKSISLNYKNISEIIFWKRLIKLYKMTFGI